MVFMCKGSSKSYSLWKNIALRSHKGTCLVLPLPFGPIAKLETVSFLGLRQTFEHALNAVPRENIFLSTSPT